MRLALAAALVFVATAGACKPTEWATVGKTKLVQADGVIDAEAGVDLEVTAADAATIGVPKAKVVRLGLARDVHWGDVEALIGKIQAAGGRAVLLVGVRSHTKALRLSDEVRGPAIKVLAYPTGKACVQAPGVQEAKCVQTGDESYIDKAFVRELVREAVQGYELTAVEIEAPLNLHWSDVVAVVDGARTCCFDQPVTVRMKSTTESAASSTILVPE